MDFLDRSVIAEERAAAPTPYVKAGSGYRASSERSFVGPHDKPEARRDTSHKQVQTVSGELGYAVDRRWTDLELYESRLVLTPRGLT